MSRSHPFARQATLALAVTMAVVLPAALSLAASDGAAKDDLAQVQGVWERVMPAGTDSPVRRITKDVRGSRETVTYYGDEGKVLRRHQVDFKVSRTGDVRVFTYSNMEVTEGQGKGEKSPEAFSYLYRVAGNHFIEVEGLLPADGDTTPQLQVWTKAGTVPSSPTAAK